MDFEKEFVARKNYINECLLRFLPEEEGYQKTVLSAMNYSINVGGKRIRPILMREFYGIYSKKTNPNCDINFDRAEPFFCAIEMIHTYSLVHDDLPAMDNDLLRRGKPTTHAAYGHAMGILSGDALLNYSVETITKAFAEKDISGEDMYDDITNEEWNRRVRYALKFLYTRSGIYGMIGGQTVDVEKTGKALTKDELEFIYRLKTCALISVSILCGAVLGGADLNELVALEKLGNDIGMAFQIQDDILDVISDEETLGKTIGSDEKNNKVTFVTLYGLDKSKEMVSAFTADAIEILKTLPENEFLTELVNRLAERKY